MISVSNFIVFLLYIVGLFRFFDHFASKLTIFCFFFFFAQRVHSSYKRNAFYLGCLIFIVFCIVHSKPNTAAGYDSNPPRVTTVDIYDAEHGTQILIRQKIMLKPKLCCSTFNVSKKKKIITNISCYDHHRDCV